MLKKISLVLVIIIVVTFIFSGCESQKPPITLSPPVWIQGEWKADTSSLYDENSDFIYFEFTSNNIIAHTTFFEISGSSISIVSFKQTYKSSVVNELITDNQYTVDISFRNQRINYSFKKIDDATLTFNYALNVTEDTRCYNFNRQ
jgi:hypothetical protein